MKKVNWEMIGVFVAIITLIGFIIVERYELQSWMQSQPWLNLQSLLLLAVIVIVGIVGYLLWQLWKWPLFRLRLRKALWNLRKALWKMYDNKQLVLGLLSLIIVVYGAFDLTESSRVAAFSFGLILATMLLTRYGLQLYDVKPPTLNEYGEVLEKIDFDYWDSPLNHGWQLGGKSEPTFRHLYYRYFGSALKIVPLGSYALDYAVTGDGQRGTKIEFVAQPDASWVVYARLVLQREGQAPSGNKWLNICHGSESPKRVGGNEWGIHTKPIQTIGKIGIYRVDLEKAVGKTYALDAEQWSYGSLEGFRLRRNLTMAYISIFKPHMWRYD
jgi:hypothetical protein